MTRINATFKHSGRSYKAIEFSSHKIEVYQIQDDGLEIFAGYTYNIPP